MMGFWGQVTIFGVIGLIFTFTNLLITRSNANSNKRSEKRRGILDVLSIFSSQDVLEGTRALWWMYDQRNKTVDYLWIKETTFQARRGGLLNVPPNFGHQRRTVLHFWITLSTLLKHELIDEKIAYELWSQSDVEIVEKIIIPLEKAIAQEHGSSGLPESHVLYYLVNNKDKFYKRVV